jgi:hypothetical protein
MSSTGPHYSLLRSLVNSSNKLTATFLVIPSRPQPSEAVSRDQREASSFWLCLQAHRFASIPPRAPLRLRSGLRSASLDLGSRCLGGACPEERSDEWGSRLARLVGMTTRQYAAYCYCDLREATLVFLTLRGLRALISYRSACAGVSATSRSMCATASGYRQS